MTPAKSWTVFAHFIVDPDKHSHEFLPKNGVVFVGYFKDYEKAKVEVKHITEEQEDITFCTMYPPRGDVHADNLEHLYGDTQCYSS